MIGRCGALCGLGLAVVAISWGAPLARMTEAAPLAVAMWRLVLATAFLVVIACGRRELPLPPGAIRPALWAGALLAVHFGLWIPSLFLTSVSASVVLVTTTPLWVLLLSPRFLGVPIRASNLVTFVLAIAGVAIISWGDFELSPRALLGDAMALGGAFAVAGYIVIGKRIRTRAPLLGYLAAVNGMAAVLLVVAVLLSGTPPWPRTAISWLPLLGMAVGPTVVGHTMLNWALAHLEAYRVNLAVLLEPVGATLLTWALLGETPPLHVVPGAALVLGGLVLEMLPRRSEAAG
ncbi:MAG: DMT family transporter [Thermoanaerobaculaceae bacterium]|nr:DMT family transporter [Thermoanaerobaculaceae bacterium]MDI9622708.1 DMT family transporter [Acidobacteriota bacterium]NLH10029.1 DMT family transporter [Holophagae bacterium]HPW56051.1 DMT family transporter [Thermoanaerobaculaceae bacterium]